MKFSQIIIDPPWPKKKGGLRKVRQNQSKNLDYETMSIDDIFKLLDSEIFPLATTRHNIFLWSIDQFLHESELEMEKRGYKRHARLIWNKMGVVAPAFTVRYAHEYCIWFYKSPMLEIDKSQRGKFTTVFTEKSRQHSRKPECIYNFIETIYPKSTYYDVFSRTPRIGWEQYGNEKSKFEI